MDPRELLLSVYEAALAAADPAAAVARHLVRCGDRLEVAGRALDVSRGLRLLGAGKAAPAMARGAAGVLGDVPLRGVLAAPRGADRMDAPVEVVEASHPVPDASSVRAGEALLRHAGEAAREGEAVLFLLSGGASALAEAPASPLGLDDLRETTALLLRSGADIRAVNAVRKHLSRLKGGGLARAAAPSPLAALILSDVIGSPLDAIGSGPTVADPTTFGEVRALCERHRLFDRLPAAVRARIEDGCAGRVPETPKPGAAELARTSATVVGDARLAAEAARARAEALGCEARVESATVEGDVARVAEQLFVLARALPRDGVRRCVVLAGEATVVVRGEGRGGRNQQLALELALRLAGTSGLTAAALATDGIDGPTDAAGAIVDGDTARRIRAQGMDPERMLAQNDALPALDAAGALVRHGATGTNVNDLFLLLGG